MKLILYNNALDRRAIWQSLARKGIPSKLINIIRAMYDGSDSRVLHNGQLSRPIHTTTGVRQGCPLSPLLFITALDDVMRKTCEIPRGIQWGIAGRLESLEYADDIVLLSHTAKDLREKLDELQKHAELVGLHINPSKTKLMKINSNDNVSNRRTSNSDGFVFQLSGQHNKSGRRRHTGQNGIWKLVASLALTTNIQGSKA